MEGNELKSEQALKEYQEFFDRKWDLALNLAVDNLDLKDLLSQSVFYDSDNSWYVMHKQEAYEQELRQLILNYIRDKSKVTRSKTAFIQEAIRQSYQKTERAKKSWFARLFKPDSRGVK